MHLHKYLTVETTGKVDLQKCSICGKTRIRINK